MPKEKEGTPFRQGNQKQSLESYVIIQSERAFWLSQPELCHGDLKAMVFHFSFFIFHFSEISLFVWIIFVSFYFYIFFFETIFFSSSKKKRRHVRTGWVVRLCVMA